ncbi:MAG: NlpC/P60 family protein [Actinomycetota bacterium]
MGLRRGLLLVLFVACAAPAAHAANPIAAKRAQAKRVEAQVNALGVQLEQVVQRWDGQRIALANVDARLLQANTKLRIARANLHTAQAQLLARLRALYVSPPPNATEIYLRAKNVSQLVDQLEAARALTQEDKGIAVAAARFRTQVAHQRLLLVREQRRRTAVIAQLRGEHARIAAGIARQRQLLASIHETIKTLQAREAARERRLAALARARIAREAELARERAAAAAVAPAPQPVPQPVADASPPAPAPIPAPVPAPAPQPASHTSAATIAARYLGVPYVWGGASPGGFDCSGLVMYVYAQLGVSLPHYTVAQWNATEPIATSDLEPGDLVFFDGLGHVGIYIGSGEFIHAPHTGTVVQIASLSGYWLEHLDGARRVP